MHWCHFDFANLNLIYANLYLKRYSFGKLKSQIKLSNMKETHQKLLWDVLWEKNHVIKPFLFEDHVINADSYLDILQNYFISQLKQLNLKHDAVFQQDGAPWHFALDSF